MHLNSNNSSNSSSNSTSNSSNRNNNHHDNSSSRNSRREHGSPGRLTRRERKALRPDSKTLEASEILSPGIGACGLLGPSRACGGRQLGRLGRGWIPSLEDLFRTLLADWWLLGVRECTV